MGLIIRILISAVAVYVASLFIPGVSVAGGAGTYLIVAIVLGFLNAFVKPILTVLTIPITIVTLGLFLLVLNVLMVYLADSLISGFDITGSGISYFITALLFSFVVSVITALIDAIV
ncbi:phage holin family protein [Spirosoma terrae]|jgi:putative membrane protein|uniref:Phage holin family protein n=1 Tax=Spirosoma terrae TaxID=1968276 RepID=A0A6L9KYH7_9BACT|nr:phage holin family protein [Spirosoma terrae]NDU93286.1 phage holin family protein [Spirosoma terrae]